jgi:hypothetical protein
LVQCSEAVWWSWILTTVGAVLEVAGLGFTGFALWDRGERHNAPPGRLRRAYRRIDHRLRARFGQPRPQVIWPEPVTVTITPGRLWPRARPGEIADHASVDDKLTWLTRYVNLLDGDIDEVIKELGKMPEEVRSDLKAVRKALEERLARQQDEFTKEMTADLGSAWAGLVLATIGVSVGLVGNLLS